MEALRPGGLSLTLRGLGLCGLLAGQGTEQDTEAGRQAGQNMEHGTGSRLHARSSDLAVVDVGCGSGATLNLLRDLGFRALGVDPSAPAQAPPGIVPAILPGILPGRAETLPLRDGTMDAAICECVLSLVPDKALAFGELRRVLKAGGVLLWTDMYRKTPVPDQAYGKEQAYGQEQACGQEQEGEHGQGREGAWARYALSLEEMRALLKRWGFTVLAEEDHSLALRELAGQMLFDGGAEASFWLGQCRSVGRGAFSPGYALFAARLG